MVIKAHLNSLYKTLYTTLHKLNIFKNVKMRAYIM